MLIEVYGYSRIKTRSQEDNLIPLSKVNTFEHETAQYSEQENFELVELQKLGRRPRV